ncbi:MULTISPECIES: endonuclease/exonuclease/phosphatase family protein [Prevotellaceae]|uniref:endonuclease/exonuclease/phosphatase family protein n=1 Tax=Prevotellaceae TaxID=171552 RepID=UPI0003D2DB86|nr:endonuclease/exonuclease/phosphatase family protein [Prevotella phocaeensis]ETD16481.1 hypothetical protein HMPREF1199_02149 [Hoylesella oralis CC98A]
MKLRYIYILTALFFALPFIGNAKELKIITFNIRSFEPDFNTQPYAELLWNENPDVVCLNEVENRSSRQQIDGKYRDVVQDLANRMHLFGLFGYSYNLSNKDGKNPEENYKYCENELYGNAILSKYPILNVSTIQLPRPTGSADQRGVVIADILLPEGKIIRVACTHLDHVGGQLEQATVLTSDEVKSNTYPTILCGDMNVGPNSDVIKKLLTVYDRLDNDSGTYLGLSKIDFILGTKGKWELKSCKVLDRHLNGKELSDHCPVVSVVKLK